MNVRRFITRHKRALIVLSSLLVCGVVTFVSFISLIGAAINGLGEVISPVMETLEPREIEIRLNAHDKLFSDATDFYSASYSFWRSRDTYVRFSLLPAKLDQFLTDAGLEAELQEGMNPFPSGMAAEALEWWNPEQAEFFSGSRLSLGSQSQAYIFVDQTDPADWIVYLAIYED